jgi:NADPH:quinone reductase-like Zn-dependent oxidoreductase
LAAPAVVELPSPHPGAGEVRVAVGAASLNGIDLTVAGGHLWDRMPHTFPVVLGRDFAGVIDAVGEGVSPTRIGERVAGVSTALTLGAGTIGEQFVVPADAVTALPSGVDDVQAAAAGLAAITALDAVTAARLTGDDVLLVVGATGGVGSFAVQLATAAGARVIATARPGAATEFARGLGAAEVVDHTRDLAAALRSVAPVGVTAVLHATGDPAVAAAALTGGGRFVSVVGATTEQLGREDVALDGVMASYTPAKLGGLLTKIAAGELTAAVASRYPLADSLAALRAFAQPKLGKIVVTLP